MNDGDDSLRFYEDQSQDDAADCRPDSTPWCVSMVDDDPGVHDATRLALTDFRFEIRMLEFVSARSGLQGRTGLGLPLSYGIVKKHRGNISVENDVGKGTRFRLTTPIRQPPPDTPLYKVHHD